MKRRKRVVYTKGTKAPKRRIGGIPDTPENVAKAMCRVTPRGKKKDTQS